MMKEIYARGAPGSVGPKHRAWWVIEPSLLVCKGRWGPVVPGTPCPKSEFEFLTHLFFLNQVSLL